MDFLNNSTTIALIFGYLRINLVERLNVKVDDFVDVISKYIIEQKIKINKNYQNITIFQNPQKEVHKVAFINKQFIVAISYPQDNESYKKMLSVVFLLFFKLFFINFECILTEQSTIMEVQLNIN